MENKGNDIKPCCIFSYDDAEAAIKNFKCEVIKNLGGNVYNEDGSVKHSTYVWDTGYREVLRCKNCGAIFLYQWSEFHGLTNGVDEYYQDCFLVRDLEEAIFLNNKYSGFDIETNFKGLWLRNSGDIWRWVKRKY